MRATAKPVPGAETARGRPRRRHRVILAAAGVLLAAAPVLGADGGNASAAASEPPGWTAAATFRTSSAGRVTGAHLYLPRSSTTVREGTLTLWSPAGTVLARQVVPLGEHNGWHRIAFTSPAQVAGGTNHSLGLRLRYSVPNTSGVVPSLAAGITIVSQTVASVAGPPTPDWPTSAPARVLPMWAPGPAATPGGFPGPGNTGVPVGTTLTPYTGPTEIRQDGTVIDARSVSGRLFVLARNVTITRSRIDGGIDVDNGGSVTVTDSEVNGGSGAAAAIGYHNVTVLRSNVYGGQHSVNCGNNCLVQDSWLHDQALPEGRDFHNNAYISNGGSGVTLRHNTLHCTPRDNSAGGGCSTNASFFGDFAPIKNVTVTGNLFKATPGGYCATFGSNSGKPHGNASANISVTDNVFERGSGGRCGQWGPVTGFAPLTGGVWSGNRWADGPAVAAAS